MAIDSVCQMFLRCYYLAFAIWPYTRSAIQLTWTNYGISSEIRIGHICIALHTHEKHGIMLRKRNYIWCVLEFGRRTILSRILLRRIILTSFG